MTDKVLTLKGLQIYHKEMMDYIITNYIKKENAPKPKHCICCGAPIDSTKYKCPYCDVEY